MNSIDYRYSNYAERLTPSAIRALASIASPEDTIRLGPGEPDPDLFALDEFREAIEDLLSDGEEGRKALQYAPTAGSLELRRHICLQMTARGVEAAPENVLLVSGAQQGIHLAGSAFLNPGDRALVQTPTYPGALQILAACGAMVADMNETGGDEKAGLVYAMSTFQNPTGITLSEIERRGILQIARDRDAVLVEDDPYEALRFDGAPVRCLLSLDAEDRSIDETRTLYLGTFSKSIAPGLRLGWIVGARPVIKKLTLMKQAEDLQVGTLAQSALVRLLDGGLEPLTDRLRTAYRARRDAMLEALRTEFGNRGTWNVPQGGFFIWVTLPSGMDSVDLLHEAAPLGVTFVPGAAFSHDGGCRNALRLSFSSVPPDRMAEGVRRLARAVDRMAG